MKITYDKKVDALNVELKAGKVKKTLEISPEIFLDIDKDGNPLYLEVVGDTRVDKIATLAIIATL